MYAEILNKFTSFFKRAITTAGRQVPTSTARQNTNNQGKTNTASVRSQPAKKVAKSVKGPIDSDSYDSDICDDFSDLTDDSDCESFSNDDDLYDTNDFNSDLSDEEVIKLNKMPTKSAKLLHGAGSSAKGSVNNQKKLNLKESEQKRPIFSTEASQERHIEMLFEQEIDPKSPSKAKEKDVKLPTKVEIKKEEPKITPKIGNQKNFQSKGKNIKSPVIISREKMADKKVADKITIGGKVLPKQNFEAIKKDVAKKIEVRSRAVIEKETAQKRKEIESKKSLLNEQEVEKKLNMFEDLKTRLEGLNKKHKEKSVENLAQAKESHENAGTTTNVVLSKEVPAKIVIKSKPNIESNANNAKEPTKSVEIVESTKELIEENKQIEISKQLNNTLEDNLEDSIIQLSPNKIFALSVCDRIDDIEKRIKEMDTDHMESEDTAKAVEPAKPVETRRKRKQVLDIIETSDPAVQTNAVENVFENSKRRKIAKNTAAPNSGTSKRGKSTKAKAEESNANKMLKLEPTETQAPTTPIKLPKASLPKSVLIKQAQEIKTTPETPVDSNVTNAIEPLASTELLVEKRQSPRLITSTSNTTENKEGEGKEASVTKRVIKKKAPMALQIRKDECKITIPAFDYTTPKTTFIKRTAKQKKGQQSKAIIKAKNKYPGKWFNCVVKVDRGFVQKYLQEEKPTPKSTGKRVTFCLKEKVNILPSPTKSPLKDVSPDKKTFTNALPKEKLSGRAQVFTIPPQHRRAPQTQTNANTEIDEQNLPITDNMQATDVNEPTTLEAAASTATTTTTTRTEETITNTTTTTGSPNSIIVIGKLDSNNATENSKLNERSVYTFYRPTLTNQDHILLDDCCPHVDPSMPAVSDLPKTAHLTQNIVDLPAYITMKTKIITRRDLKEKRCEIPPAVKNRVEQLTVHVNNNHKDKAVMRERMFVRQSLLGIDRMLKREIPLMYSVNLADRQKVVEELAQTQNYKPADMMVVKTILQKYFNTLSKLRDETKFTNLATLNRSIVNNKKTATNTGTTNEETTLPIIKYGSPEKPDQRQSLSSVQPVRAKKPAYSPKRRTTIDAPSTSMPELRQQLERKSIIVTRKASTKLTDEANKEVLVVNEALEDEDEPMAPEVILPDIIRDESVSIVKNETIEDDFIG